MDRISALRNIEEALREFEAGEAALDATERRVVTILRTYATDFGDEEGLAAFRARGDDRAEGLVVVADSSAAARERMLALLGTEAAEVEFDLERLG